MSFTSGPYATHARAVLAEQDEFEKKNTLLAYNNKVSEFVGFCHSLFPSTSAADNAATVNEEKLFGYLFYTSRRSVRNRGIKHRNSHARSSSSIQAGMFDREEYDRVMDSSYSEMNNLVGFDVLNQTYSGILRLWKRECDLGTNNASKDQLRSQRVMSLMNVVKKRKKRMARRDYQEKVKSVLSPYLMVDKIPMIEAWLWQHNAASSTYFSLASIRDRFVFLLSTHAILRDNKSWFGIKALVDYRKNELTKAVTDQSYAKAIKACCKDMSISSRHFVHIGRSVGPIIAEIAEVDGDSIANLGNWNVTVREDRYSAKLPLRIMRVMAGHSAEKNVFHLPRSDLKPSEDLQRQIFPFIEDHEMILASSPVSHPTALAFLGLLKRLRAIVLQDAAVLLDSGRKHSLFCMEVFTSSAFLEFQTRLLELIHQSRVDPSSLTVRAVLPGICERLDNLRHQSQRDSNTIRDEVKQLASTTASKQDMEHYISQFARHIGAFQCPPPNIANDSSQHADPAMISVAPLDLVIPYKLKSHNTVTGIWNEWFGLPSTPGMQVSMAGMYALEQAFKAKWRTHFLPAESKQFSRMKYIVHSVSNAIEATGKSTDEILTEYDALFKSCNFSLFKMEQMLKGGQKHWQI
ncbi:Centromere DNA-binding protein complex CBF3 subunit [Fragilaria crotonensis]|nr:Centromere DNA-binding protein complex CBF3 subunit [Fragilaria crotonensis]